jgi:hypothetical protein
MDEAFLKTLPFMKFAPLLGIAALALVWSWNQPLLSSHSFRQTETAQMAQIFMQEGWTPLVTHFRFIPKPGIAILEFPLYQSFMVAGAQWGNVSLENAGRILSCLSALMLALATAAALGFVASLLALEDVIPSETAALLVLCSPLIFGTSQWVSVELMNAAFAAWSFILFGMVLKTKKTGLQMMYGFAYGTCAALSLVMKPHGMFAIFPLFIWLYVYEQHTSEVWRLQRRTFWIQTGFLSVSSILALWIAATWYRYGQRTNEAAHCPYAVSNSFAFLLFGEHKIWQPDVLVRLMGRFSLYVLGPGSIVLFGFLAFQQSRLPIKRTQWVFAMACMAAIFLYVAIFTGANYHHNYYQVATVFPLFLGLFVLLSWPKQTRTQLLVAVALIINIGISFRLLAHQDPYWKQLLQYADTHMRQGYDQPTLNIVSNWGASSAVLSYYLKRWTQDQPFSAVPKEWGQGDWLGLCDDREETRCKETFEHLNRLKPTVQFGPLTLFDPRESQ